MGKPTTETHRLHDIEQIALMYAIGREPLRVENDGERFFFVFAADDETKHRIMEYVTSGASLLLRADKAFWAYRAARKRLSEEKRAAGRFVDHG
jgi:hypothetical protein